jgi:hypothetical protein
MILPQLIKATLLFAEAVVVVSVDGSLDCPDAVANLYNFAPQYHPKALSSW